MLPTIFLWVVDTLSMKRGTWTIEEPTKLGIQLWGYIDIEEAFFFLITNVLIVFGLVSIDYAISIATCQQVQSMKPTKTVPLYFQILIRFVTDKYNLDKQFVNGLAESVAHLSASSQSMYMGSAMFQGPLRIDLILLYSFFRVADNLVDDARETESARRVIEQCDQLLELKFSHPNSFSPFPDPKCVTYAAPPELVAAIDRLPVSRLRLELLKDLLEGFRTDLEFGPKPGVFPIVTESDLDTYSSHVASTVAASMLGLIVHHFSNHEFAVNVFLRRRVIDAAETMGQALQYINVARDIARDAAINRVYLPTTWLEEHGLSPTDVLAFPTDPRLEMVREKILDRADFLSASARDEIAYLPEEVQGPLLATVDSYLEIGAALRQSMRPEGLHEKLKLPLGRRLWVVYRAMALRR
ncbi:hypothetical protein BBP40_008154 [Aspergillus hancockii]|nr:hypothetical protein BBP40_008154 [Aspergillus hancockii]